MLRRVVASEFGLLVLWGMGIGAMASALAVWPNLHSLPPVPTLALVMLLLAGIVGLNLFCGHLVFNRIVRGMSPVNEDVTR